MDIRRWLTAKNVAASASSADKNEKEDKKLARKKEEKSSKKRRIESDSDEEDFSRKKKNQHSPKKEKKSPSYDHLSKPKDKKSKRKIESSDEDIEVITEETTKKQRITPQKSKAMEPKKAEPPKPLKPKSASDFFGDAPVERAKRRSSPRKPKKSSIETNHDDDDFSKTLMQLEEESTKKVEKKSSPKEVKKEKPEPKSKKSKHHPDLEIIPSQKQKEPKKVVVQEAPPPKPPAKKGNASFMSYMVREGPRALGSKEIPEGEEDCLKGKTFVITGILESIERDDAKALIERHGGKVMTTLTKNTKYMVIGRDAGSSKLEKAEKFGTIQLDEDGLFDLIRTSPGTGPRKKSSPQKTETIEDTAPTKSKFGSFAFEAKTSSEKVDVKSDSPKKPVTSASKIKKEETKTEAKSPEKLKQELGTPEKTKKSQVAKTTGNEMWVDKYKPTSMKQVIGQQGDKSNAKKLYNWLINWSKHTKNKKPAVAGRWNTTDDGSGFKAALLSGPPGIGKTTTAHLVCKEADFDFMELNASDTRSKKSLQSLVSELLRNQSLSSCFSGQSSKLVSSKHAIIMDEVDGMAGNEDRGGVQELIGFIKMSKIPIICICNDRNHPKIRSLSNYCFDLRFQKPRVEQIKAAMMSIAFKEGLTVTPNVLQDVIVASNQDIRQVLHNLSVWCSKERGLSAEQAKHDIGYGVKNVKMGPFDVLREVFSIGNNKKATINDKAALFFHDYSIAPLFVQENYVHVLPSAASGSVNKHLKLISEAADSMCVGDLIDKQIRSQSSWSLLPTQAIFSSVIPGELLTGHMKQMISFPTWLGKNSNRNHMDRILQELQMHMRMRITGNKTDVCMEYLPLLKRALTKPLVDDEAEGIKQAVDAMKYYCLLREDFDSVIELSLWPSQTDPRSKISTKVKSAFTRYYNKECIQNPYAVTNVSKKKKKPASEDGLLGEDAEPVVSEDDEEEEDKLENDAMIKVKKPSNKASTDESVASSSSKKSSKAPAKKGRSKK